MHNKPILPPFKVYGRKRSATVSTLTVIEQSANRTHVTYMPKAKLNVIQVLMQRTPLRGCVVSTRKRNITVRIP
jgi:hypothetical protein